MSRSRGVAVVALGELARSPRMLNHARALAAGGRTVALIGYGPAPGTMPKGVGVWLLHPLRRVAPARGTAVFAAASAVRMGLLFFELTARLLRDRPECIVVQNPPGFPTLTAARLAARFCGARVIVDWHNYGFSMLALRLGSKHRLVRWAEQYEGRAARRAAAHLCVSHAMRDDLARRFGIEARVLYDRPAALLPASTRDAKAPLTVVCPSGWTADEDIGLLLDALELLPPQGLEVHLTGDGPLRTRFAERIAALRASGCDIHADFLTEPDYRRLLARADLGVSVHRSSSGLDLAMKVVDLFAAGTPVCALDYGGCLREQVEDGVTGFVFRTAATLTAAIARVRDDRTGLEAMRRNIAERWSESWQDAWRREAGPLFARREAEWIATAAY
ncbi:MAG TPA: glycosyltransferase [Bryobacteraceae bacterium]